ncbi:hypothetical protein [Lentzea indica]|nr:hypothetical protein [Lentzea indica]
MSENKNQPEVAEVDDESMDEVSGGLPNGGEFTINGEGSNYTSIED